MGRANAAVLPVPVCASPYQIFTGKHNRKRAKLNWRRLDKAHCLRPAHYLRRKSKFVKRHAAKVEQQREEAIAARISKKLKGHQPEMTKPK